MKFIIDKAKLANMVTSVQRVVNAKSTLAILGSILVEANAQGIQLTATDLSIGMRYCFATDVEEPGKVAIPAKAFGDLVRKLPDGNITLTTNEDNTRVTIQYGLFSEFTLGVLDASEYPLIPIPEDCRQVKLPQGILKEMIKQVIVAADINATDRPIFQGALLEIAGGQMVIVSTDTHRLAYRHWSLPEEATSEQVSNIIIPARTLVELGRILDEDKEQANLTVGFADNQIVFASEATTLISRLIEGKYPPFRNVVPKAFTSEITVKRAQLLNSLERAELLTRATSEATKLTLGDGKLAVDVKCPTGSLHEEIQMTHEGQPLVIGFNTDYMVDGLKTMDTEEVVIKFTGPVGAAVIEPVGNDTQFYLALPVRLAQAA